MDRALGSSCGGLVGLIEWVEGRSAGWGLASFLMGILPPLHSQLGGGSWKASASKLPPGQSFGPQGISTMEYYHQRYLSVPQPFSKVVLTWRHLERILYLFLHLGAALAASIPPP